MNATVARWLRRYLPAEAVGLLAAVLAASVAAQLTANNVAVAAVVAAWAETVAYYATMLARELRPHRSSPLTTLRNLLLEFGPAEALDSLLLRPALMYLAAQFLPNLALSVIAGKLAADVTFYVPTITAYELRRRYLPT